MRGILITTSAPPTPPSGNTRSVKFSGTSVPEQLIIKEYVYFETLYHVLAK